MSALLNQDVPPTGDETVRLNFWLDQATPPSADTNSVYEIVISKFEFIPLAQLHPNLAVTQVLTNKTTLHFTYP